MDLLAHLDRCFGFQSFRHGQREACESIVAGKDTIVLMPTGAGKSLCYQLPGILRDGVTLVVSPLISLAKDQAEHLKKAGQPTVVLNSTRTKKQIESARRRLPRERSSSFSRHPNDCRKLISANCWPVWESG